MTDELPALPEPVFARQFDLLKLELTLIDNAIRSHDEIMKSVKQWAIVAWTGGIGLALGGNSTLKSYVWATALVPLTFWIVDGAFRRIQRSFIVRVQNISSFINSKAFVEFARGGHPMEFPLLKMRSKAGDHTSWLAVMCFRTVAAVYVLMVLGSVVIWALVATRKM